VDPCPWAPDEPEPSPLHTTLPETERVWSLPESAPSPDGRVEPRLPKAFPQEYYLRIMKLVGHLLRITNVVGCRIL